MNILINQEQTSFAKEHTKDFPVQPVSIDAKAGKGSKKHFSITIELENEEIENILAQQKYLLINMPILISGLNMLHSPEKTANNDNINDNIAFLTMQELADKIEPNEATSDVEDTPAFQHFLIKMAKEAELELKTNKKSYNNIDDLINALQD